MKKNIGIAIIGVAVIFLAVSLLYAQDYNDTGAFRRPAGKGQQGAIVKALNLTPEQEHKLQENRKAQRQELAGLMEAIREKQEKLQSELKDPKATRAKLQPLIAEIKSLQVRLIDQRINGIFAVKEILTAEQFAKFQELVAKKDGKMQRPASGRQPNRMHEPNKRNE